MTEDSQDWLRFSRKDIWGKWDVCDIIQMVPKTALDNQEGALCFRHSYVQILLPPDLLAGPLNKLFSWVHAINYERGLYSSLTVSGCNRQQIFSLG